MLIINNMESKKYYALRKFREVMALEKIGKFVEKYALWIIIITVLLTVFLAYQVKYLRTEDDITRYPPKEEEVVKLYDSLAEEFGINSIVMVGFDLNEPNALARIDEITESVSKLKGVSHVTSVTNIPLVVNSQDGIEVSTVSELLKKGTVSPSYLVGFKNLNGKFISSNGKAAMMLVSLERGKESEGYLNLKNVVEKSYGAGTHFFGVAAVNEAVKEITLRNLLKLVPISLIITFSMLLIAFRRITGALLPLLGVAISVLWTLGLIALFGFNITVANSVIPVALISIGTAYPIHIVNKYYEEKGERGQRVISTISDVGIAVLMSGLTTAVGFLSLLTANIKPVWVMGIFTSIGVMLCNFIALFFIPAVLYYINPKAKFHVENVSYKGERLNSKLVIAVFLGLVLLMIPSLFKLKADMDIVASINNKEKIIVDKEFFDKNFGGCDYLFVDVRGDFNDPSVLIAMDEIERKVKNLKGVVSTYSIVDTLLDLSKSFTGFYSIPFSKEELANLWFFLKGNDSIYSVVNKNFNRGIIQITVKTRTESEMRSLIKHIDEIVNSTPKGYVLRSKPDFGYYAKKLNVKAEVFKNAFESAKNVPFSTLAAQHVEDLKKSIENVQNLVGQEIDSKGDILSKLLQIGSFTESEFENLLSGNPDFGLSLYNELYSSLRKWRAQYFAKELGVDYNESTEQYLKVVSEENGVYVPSENSTYKAFHTGATEIALFVSDLLFKNQYQSMILTLVMVFVLLFIQMRSLKISLIGIIPSILTVYFNFVLMGIFGVPLNTATISIAAIAIGAGVDYAIHFISRYKIELEKDLDELEAIFKTVITSGRGIIFNALAVSFGFFTFAFSDIKMLRQFGILTGITLLLSAFITIVFLASAFSLTVKKTQREREVGQEVE